MRRLGHTTLSAFLSLLLTCASAGAAIFAEGTVLGPDGQGLAGPTVEIRPVLRVYEQSVREIEGRGVPEPVALAVTSRGGWYELWIPGPGAWQISVSAEGFVPMSLRPTVLIGGEIVLAVRMEAPPRYGYEVARHPGLAPTLVRVNPIRAEEPGIGPS